VVVLDNVADTAQLRPLLPGSPTCFVLVTSRRRLTGLEGARSLALDVMPVEDAVQLFTRSMARAGEEPEAVEETVKLCGQLPVAIRIAAGRLRHRGTWSVAHLAQRLRGQQRRLAELTVEDHSVSAVFELSYQQLDTAQRRMFRLLGVSPGQAVDAYAAAALTGMDVFDAENLLEDLLDSNLLVQRVTGRYVFHDLVREHAIARATAEESQAELDDAITAVLDYYLTAAAAAADQFQPNRRDPEFDVSTGPAVLPRLVTHEAAIDWLEAERPNLTAAVNLAATTGRTRYAWQLAHAIWGFLYVRGYPDDWLLTVEAAHKAVVAVGDTRGEACIMIDLGLAYHHFGRTGESLDALRRALELNRASGNTATQASALSNLSMIYESVGRYTDALRAEEASFGLFEELGQRFWVGATLNNLAGIHTKLGRWHEAAQEYQRVLALHAESGDQSYEGRALTSLGDVLLHLGEVDQALDHHRRALKLNRAAGDRWGESLTLSNLGVALRATGELVTSLEELRQALDIQEEVGDRGLRAIIRIELGHTLCRMGRLEAAAAEHQRVLDLVRDTQNRYATARALDGLAQVHRAAGRITEARENWLSALEIFTALGVYQAGEVTAELSGLPAAARQAAG
jgi:tetratricopeptide (TPR) repeat protein